MPTRRNAGRRGAGSRHRYRYLLGDSRREAARLRAQARLWDPVATALFDRLRVRRGWKVLEIGPGQGSLHMELRRRVGGPVDAVERSPAFAARLRRLCARDRFGPDHIFVKLVRALRPGGLLAIEDYHRETFALIPRPREWADLMAADRAFFASQGGDASIGGRLPELYRRAGLEIVAIDPNLKVGRPGSPVWRWLSTYFLGVLDRYAEHPPLTRGKAARLRRRFLAAARADTSLMIAPAVIDVIGRKPL